MHDTASPVGIPLLITLKKIAFKELDGLVFTSYEMMSEYPLHTYKNSQQNMCATDGFGLHFQNL